MPCGCRARPLLLAMIGVLALFCALQLRIASRVARSAAPATVRPLRAAQSRARVTRAAASVEGDLTQPGVLARAAAAVARPVAGARAPAGALELVLLPVSSNYAHLVLNLQHNMARLNYTHVLLLAQHEPDCARTVALSPLPARCVWDSRWATDAQLRARAERFSGLCARADCTSTMEPSASYRAWLSRWIAHARLVALGYNVLMLDADVALVDDVFAFFNAPPLDGYALLAHSESLDDPFGNVQCGLVFTRGALARPGGGAAAVAAGYALRALRLLDSLDERRAPAAAPRAPLARLAGAYGPIAREASSALFPAANGSAPTLPPPWLELRRAQVSVWFDQVHVVDVVQSQIGGRATFRMARGYDAAVNRGQGPRDAPYELGVAHADGTGSVAVVGRAEALAAAAARAGGGAAALAVAAEPLTSHRVNSLYEAYLRSKGVSYRWHRRALLHGGALPAGWRERFATSAADEAIWEAELRRGWPADVADLPLEGGAPPLAPVREGSLAARFLATLEADAAAAAPAARDGARGAPPPPPERVALLPTWLVSHWREGIKGGWGVEPPAAIAVHATNAVDKLLALAANGLWDARAYAAAEGSVHAGALLRGERVPVVAYDPALARGAAPPLQLASADEWRDATLRALPAAAAVGGRALAHAHVPCASAWLNHGAAAEGARWSQRGCRTGLCAEWRVTAVGYASADEAAARARALPAAAPRARPLAGWGGNASGAGSAGGGLVCDVHPNMAWPDGRERHRFGPMCNGHAPHFNLSLAAVGHALSAWDLAAYAARLGAEGAPDPARNVAFATEARALRADAAAGRAPRLLRVSEAQLRAEMERLRERPIVYLGWPLSVGEMAPALSERVRTFCCRVYRNGRESARPDLRPLPPEGHAAQSGANADTYVRTC